MYQAVCLNRGTEAERGKLMWATRSPPPKSFHVCYEPVYRNSLTSRALLLTAACRRSLRVNTMASDHWSQKKTQKKTGSSYCFRTQVFEAIAALLVGPNLLLIGGIQTINQKHVECIPPSSSKILKLAFDNRCRLISHWLLTSTHSVLRPGKMAAAAISWPHFLNNRSPIQSFFEISASDPY